MTAEQIKELRKKFGLTQTQLAKKLDVHPLTVSRWERGEIHPHSAMLKKLHRLERKA